MNANCVDERALVGFVQVICLCGCTYSLPHHRCRVPRISHVYSKYSCTKELAGLCHQHPLLAQEDLVNNNQFANWFLSVAFDSFCTGFRRPTKVPRDDHSSYVCEEWRRVEKNVSTPLKILLNLACLSPNFYAGSQRI